MIHNEEAQIETLTAAVVLVVDQPSNSCNTQQSTSHKNHTLRNKAPACKAHSGTGKVCVYDEESKSNSNSSSSSSSSRPYRSLPVASNHKGSPADNKEPAAKPQSTSCGAHSGKKRHKHCTAHMITQGRKMRRNYQFAPTSSIVDRQKRLAAPQPRARQQHDEPGAATPPPITSRTPVICPIRCCIAAYDTQHPRY